GLCSWRTGTPRRSSTRWPGPWRRSSPLRIGRRRRGRQRSSGRFRRAGSRSWSSTGPARPSSSRPTATSGRCSCTASALSGACRRSRSWVNGRERTTQSSRSASTATSGRSGFRPCSRYPWLMAQDFGGFEKVLRLGEGRRLKRLAQQAAYITSLEPEFEALSDDELRGKTVGFRERLADGGTLEELLFEAVPPVAEGR